MNTSSSPKISYGGQLAILLGLIFVGLMLAGAIQIAMTLTIVDFKTLMSGDSDKLMKILLLPQHATMMKLMQVLGTIALFCLPTIVYARIANKKPLRHLGFKSPLSINQLLLVMGIAACGLFLSGALGELNELIPIPASWAKKFKAMEEAYATQVMAMATMKNFGEYLIGMLIIAVLPAIFEEMLFRAGIQQILEKLSGSILFSLIFTSFLFSIIHFSYYGFLPRMGLGIILGLIFYYSKNVWLSIFAHFLNNGVAITAIYIATKNGKLPKEVLDEKFPIWLGLLTLVIIVFLLKIFKKESKKLGANDWENMEG